MQTTDPTEQLRAEATARGWDMPTGVARKRHDISGDYATGPAWDLIEVGVLWVSSQARWQVLGHRWTTVDGWGARKFHTFPAPDVCGTVTDALDAGAALLAGLVARLEAGTLPAADKG